MADDWDRLIGRAAEACQGCGGAFGAEAEVVTQLLVDAAGFSRRDVCDACAAAQPQPEALFSFWRVKRGSAPPPARRLDLSYMLELFQRLAGPADRAEGRELRWIVTLLLLRKKLLELVGRSVTPEGAELLSVRIRKDEQVHQVLDPQLSPDQMAALGDDLGRIFNLEAKPGPTETPRPRTA